MVRLCFATNNRHKIAEISQILGEAFRIQSLEEVGCDQELPENQDTLEGNSLEKARFIYENYHQSCFADDTGLEVDALNGEPGVRSARRQIPPVTGSGAGNPGPQAAPTYRSRAG